jgi:putative DNA primase/helicase
MNAPTPPPDLSQIWSPEAESALLGGLLLDTATLPTVSALLRPASFFEGRDRAIYEAVCALSETGVPVDLITVFELLQTTGNPQGVDLSYLAALSQFVPSTKNMLRYAEIIADRAVVRQMLTAAEDIKTVALAHGLDASQRLARAQDLVAAVRAPAPLVPRYKLLDSADLHALAPLQWRIRGVLPAVGLAAMYGPSGCGKSFLAFDMACAIAEGRDWFGHRVKAAPVLFVALEGEAGMKLRAQAWEASHGRALPERLQVVLQPFKLTEAQDVRDLAAVLPAGGVLVIDTLNRAAPTADENSSRDLGEILEAAKRLQNIFGGLVVLIHHTGKDEAKELRGHSSLFAALDAAVKISRDGDRREWKVAKSKDGADGHKHLFVLDVEMLGSDAEGNAMTSCVVVPDNTAQDVQRAKLPQGGNQKLVLDALRPLFADGKTARPGAPPLRPCIELEAAIASASTHLPCETFRRATRARDAITSLIARGVLGCNEGWLWLT